MKTLCRYAVLVFVLLLLGLTGCPASLTANFSAAPVTGAAPLNVNFTDMSQQGNSRITSWLWDFGDGATSNIQDPTHQYEAGTFSVTLTVQSADGSNSATKANYITVSGEGEGEGEGEPIEITIGAGTGAAGNTVSVPVTLTAGNPGPAVILMTILFNSQVLSFSTATAEAAITSAGKTLATNEPAAGQVRIIIYSGITAMTSGELFSVEFNVLGGSSSQIIPLTGSNGTASDAQANPIPVNFQNGQIQIE